MMETETPTLQDAFEAQMAETYCKDPPNQGDLWDPILYVWRSPDSGLVKATHLFPRRQARFMNSIFGSGAIDDLFAPCNGLFLYPAIEEALHSGYLSIVPDVELDDMEPWWDKSDVPPSMTIPEWEKREVKNYKVIVLDKRSPGIRQLFANYKDDIAHDWWYLDGRKLLFRSDHRPRELYIWWTYLNTILHADWRIEDCCDMGKGEFHKVFRRATQYWKPYGNYAKKSQIMGFIQKISNDSVEDFLCKGFVKDDDTEDARPEAAEALLLEIIARSEEDGEDDFDTDEDDVKVWVRTDRELAYWISSPRWPETI
ncbi:hypothetical protein FPOAC2_04311 [Fusarium poae]|jgi:hypothetical protein